MTHRKTKISKSAYQKTKIDLLKFEVGILEAQCELKELELFIAQGEVKTVKRQKQKLEMENRLLERRIEWLTRPTEPLWHKTLHGLKALRKRVKRQGEDSI